MKKLEDIKSFIKFVNGYFRMKIKMDKNSAIDKYIEISKQYDVGEQIDGYVTLHNELKPILKNMLHFCQTEVKKSCGDNNKCKILDYGCGSGRYLALLKNYDLYGIDANQYTLDHFTSKKVPQAKLYQLDFTDIKDKKVEVFLQEHQNSFDIIYSMSVIQFLQMSKIDLWFDAVTKLLKKDGKIILNFPLPKEFFDRYHIGYLRFTPQEIIYKLESRGCKIVYSSSNFYNEELLKYQTREIDYGYNIVAIKK